MARQWHPAQRSSQAGASLRRSGWGASPWHALWRISPGRLGSYLSALGDLLHAGVTLYEAMSQLGQYAADGRLRRMSREIAAGAQAGEALSQQLRRYPQLLPPHVRGMLWAGERAGALPHVCRELAEELQAQQRARWAASVMQLWFGASLVLAILVYGIPRVISAQGPNFEAYLEYLQHVALPILGGLAGLVILGRGLGAIPALARPIQWLLYYLPGIGGLIRQAALGRVAVALRALLRAGVEIQEALYVAAESAGNVVIQQQLQQAGASARAGRPLAEALRRVRCLPPAARESLLLGERAGTYEHALEVVATEAKARRGRAVLWLNVAGYGLLLLLSATLVAAVVAHVYIGYFQALLRFTGSE